MQPSTTKVHLAIAGTAEKTVELPGFEAFMKVTSLAAAFTAGTGTNPAVSAELVDPELLWIAFVGVEKLKGFWGGLEGQALPGAAMCCGRRYRDVQLWRSDYFAPGYLLRPYVRALIEVRASRTRSSVHRAS